MGRWKVELKRTACIFWKDTQGGVYETLYKFTYESRERLWKAKTLLQQYFVNATKITAAYMEELDLQLRVKMLPCFRVTFYSYVGASMQCVICRTQEKLTSLLILKQSFPFKQRERFRSLACDICGKRKRKPNFSGIMHFVEHQV